MAHVTHAFLFGESSFFKLISRSCHPSQVTASGFFNVTVDVHRQRRGEAYRQWQRSVDVAEATVYDV